MMKLKDQIDKLRIKCLIKNVVLLVIKKINVINNFKILNLLIYLMNLNKMLIK